MIKVGDIYKDYIGEVTVIAILGDRWIVAKRKKCVPFIKSIKEFPIEYEQIESKEYKNTKK